MGSGFHAELSPSKRHRWGACPGSVREEAKYPEPPSGPAAYDGTRTHALLEELIQAKPPGQLPLRAPQMLVGREVTDEYGTYTVDQDRVDRLNVALDYIRSRPNAEHAVAEQRVHPDGFVRRGDMSGTIDVQIPGDPYEIIDYKDGMSVVEAENNPQLEQYALGVLAGLEKHPKKMRLTIIQPKLAAKGMDPVSSWEVEVKHLVGVVAPLMVQQAAATDDPNAPLVPGEKQCRYCKAKGACPALMEKVSDMFTAVGVIEPGTLDVAQQVAGVNPDQMTGDQLARLLEAAPLVEQLLRGVKEEVERRLTSNIPVPGFKLVRGNGSRGWNPSMTEEEVAKKLMGMGIPKSAVYVTSLVSPAQAEKLAWEKKGETVRLSKIQIERLNAEYVTKREGKITVAPESDKRPAVVTDASGMFGSVVEQIVDVQATVVQPAPLPPWMSAPVESTPEIPSWLASIKDAPVMANVLPPWMK